MNMKKERSYGEGSKEKESEMERNPERESERLSIKPTSAIYYSQTQIVVNANHMKSFYVKCD